MPGVTEEEVVAQLERAFALLDNVETVDGRDAAGRLLYAHNANATKTLAELKAHLAKGDSATKEERAKAGEQLETLCYRLFNGLKGKNSVKSYRSSGSQLDLLITGSSPQWMLLCKYLRVDDETRGFLIEAKATQGPAGDPVIQRLYALSCGQFQKQIALTVLVSFHGATGVPTSGDAPARTLRDARFTQAVAYFRHKLPIVVIDLSDLEAVCGGLSLAALLERKVRELEEQTGLPTSHDPCDEIVLPPHMVP